MTTRDRQRAQAAARHDTLRATATIIRRGGDPDLIAAEIYIAYTGRFTLTPKRATAPRCTEHPDITPPCPICRT